MSTKGIIITCFVVVLYLSLCSWRFDRLEEKGENYNNQMVLNVK